MVEWLLASVLVGNLTPAILLRRIVKNAAGERSEPAASVPRRQQQLLVRMLPGHSGIYRLTRANIMSHAPLSGEDRNSVGR